MDDNLGTIISVLILVVRSFTSIASVSVSKAFYLSLGGIYEIMR